MGPDARAHQQFLQLIERLRGVTLRRGDAGFAETLDYADGPQADEPISTPDQEDSKAPGPVGAAVV